MRLVFLSSEQTLVLDIIAWVIFQISIGFATSRIPVTAFDPQRKWYQSKNWEKGGEIYQKIFRVKDWKGIIPSGAALYKGAYEIKHMAAFTVQNVSTWIRESCRSEFCHWVMMIPGVFFFMWNSTTGGWLNLAYAVANNLVPIIMQRYNRPRVRKLLAELEKRTNLTGEPPVIHAVQTNYSHSYE
jgi:glycosyl-4,4'-diaponeurosporenoate acyltransferase